jgi:DDE superfamily endonuclease
LVRFHLSLFSNLAQYFGHWCLVDLDDVKFHYSHRAISLIEAFGASVEPLPVYAPDFNLIEERISKIKTTLRSLKARGKRKLNNALAKAIKMISVDDICGWFANCFLTHMKAAVKPQGNNKGHG